MYRIIKKKREYKKENEKRNERKARKSPVIFRALPGHFHGQGRDRACEKLPMGAKEGKEKVRKEEAKRRGNIG